MHENITISDLNVEIHGNGNNIKRHLAAKFGIGLVEFLLASVLFCYGIILSEYVFIGSHNFEEGIWASILFICSWSFTDPIARFISEYFEDTKINFFRYLVVFCTAILFIGVMFPNNTFGYMILGGILSNLISNQISVFALDKLDMDAKIFEAIRQISRALSLFVMPQCVYWLAAVPDYGINQVKLIFASILLHIIPAAMIIKTDEKWLTKVRNTEMSRYQTIGRLTHQMSEMKSFSKEENDGNQSESSSISSEEKETPVFEINPKEPATASLLDSPGCSIANGPSNQYLENDLGHFVAHGVNKYRSEHCVEDVLVPSMYLNSANTQSYFINVGVNVLPGIPEENEEDDREDINYIDPKRLSVISDKLEELKVQEQVRRDSIKEVFNIKEVLVENKPEPISKIEYISNFKEEKSRVSVLDELKNFPKARHCFQCSPYRRYIWTRRLRMLKDFSSDNFVRPSYYAVKNIYFYPSLTTKVITNLVSTLYITLGPFMAMQQSWKQELLSTTENVTFLLTYVAFAWCFFLVGLPLVLKMSHSRIRILFGFGLVVSGTGLWVLSGNLTNDVITLSSLLFGFGYGIITYTEKIVFKTSIGMRPWYLVRGPLEIFSAIFISLIYYLIYSYRLNLNLLLLLAALSYYFNALLWFCLPFVKYFTSIFKRIVFDERSQQEGFFH